MTKRRPVCPPNLYTRAEQLIALGWGTLRIATHLNTDMTTIHKIRARMDSINTQPDTADPPRARRIPAVAAVPDTTRDLLTDTVCPVGHAIYTVDDLTADARCNRCEGEMRAERRHLGEAARERSDRAERRGVFRTVADSLNDMPDAGRNT